MIEYALLIMLGFCVGGLIAFLLAPTLWHRAVRLTTKRLEATLPMSLSDIEADKDLLKASYAIKIRRLEAGLGKAREKSATQLVEISRLQMTIGELQDQISDLDMQLDERKNAANVFESTIRKRFPELESAVAAAKQALDERSFEINDLTNKLRRRDEALTLAQRAGHLQQDEIRRLRETLEKSGSDATGRFKRRPTQWTLDEYRSEYDRLNVELSKMREQLVLGAEREASQIAVLKTELQQLGEQIMSSVAAQDRASAAPRAPEGEANPWPGGRSQPAAVSAPKRGTPPRPAAKARPWPGERPQKPELSAPQRPPVKSPAPQSAGLSPAPMPTAPAPAAAAATRDLTAPALGGGTSANPAETLPAPLAPDRPATGGKTETPVRRETRDALQSLLDRGAKAAAEDGAAKPALRPSSSLTTAIETSVAAMGAEDRSAGETAVKTAPAPAPAPERPQPAAEPKLDQMFREIFEGRGVAAQGAAPAQPPSEPAVVDGAAAPKLEAAPNAPTADGDTKRTLLDRLKVMHERQTG